MSAIACSFLILTLFSAISADEKLLIKIDSRFSLTNNDTILEIFHNCTCVAYYCCQESASLLVAAAAKALPEDIECSDSNYLCCAKTKATDSCTTVPSISTTSSTSSTSTTTSPSVVTPVTPKGVTLKEVQFTKSCGVSRTLLTVRALTPDDEGASTIMGEEPWMVAIFRKGGFKCSGSLIHPRVVLTATHCVLSAPAESLTVLATGKEVFQGLGTSPENERKVLKKILHPKYYSGGLFNDIALLILEEAYDYSTVPLNSLCLPQPGQNFTEKRCNAVGWEKNEPDAPLRKVDLPIVDSERCQELLRSTRLGPNFNLHSSFVCAGGEKGKDTCQGDGGAPLICLGNDYKYVQVGIVSWGLRCGVENEPGLYTDLTKLHPWITEELTKESIDL